MRWPFMTKSRHEQVVSLLNAQHYSNVQAYLAVIEQEYARAIKDGNAKVHAFMRDANYNVFQHPRPDVAIRAVFQQAEREFRPTPPTMKEEMDAIPATAP